MAEIVIANITVYDPALPGERVLTFATQGYVSLPSESPADTFYEPRIEQPANISRQCFSAGTTYGASTIGYGDMVLINNDGGLDYLLDYSFSGRKIEIKIGTVTQANHIPVWVTLISGVMQQAVFSWGRINIRVRDRQQELTTPLQQVKYNGGNVLPAGFEGVAEDLKDKSKPLLWGRVQGIAPPCVNTSKLIYQISSDAIDSVAAVYDRGVALTAGATYASAFEVQSYAPTAGQYRVWPAGGCIRLGASPTGTVTVDAVQGAAASNRTVAQITKAILLKAGIDAGDISSTDVSTLDSACNYEVGVWLAHGQETSGAALIDEVTNSIGAWWGVDRLGQFRLGRISRPVDIADPIIATLTPTEIISIDRTNTADDGAGVPAWSVSVGYARVYSPTEDLAGSVSAVEKARVAEEYRRSVVTDSTIKTTHKYSPELVFDTQLVSESDAAAEALRRLLIYGQRRDMLQLRVRLDPQLAAGVDLGRMVSVQMPRFGFDAGKKFLIVGIRTDMRNNTFDLTVWG